MDEMQESLEAEIEQIVDRQLQELGFIELCTRIAHKVVEKVQKLDEEQNIVKHELSDIEQRLDLFFNEKNPSEKKKDVIVIEEDEDEKPLVESLHAITKSQNSIPLSFEHDLNSGELPSLDVNKNKKTETSFKRPSPALNVPRSVSAGVKRTASGELVTKIDGNDIRKVTVTNNNNNLHGLQELLDGSPSGTLLYDIPSTEQAVTMEECPLGEALRDEIAERNTEKRNGKTSQKENQKTVLESLFDKSDNTQIPSKTLDTKESKVSSGLVMSADSDPLNTTLRNNTRPVLTTGTPKKTPEKQKFVAETTKNDSKVDNVKKINEDKHMELGEIGDEKKTADKQSLDKTLIERNEQVVDKASVNQNEKTPINVDTQKEKHLAVTPVKTDAQTPVIEQAKPATTSSSTAVLGNIDKPDSLPIKGGDITSKSSTKIMFEEGDRVLGKPDKSDIWYPGSVAKVIVNKYGQKKFQIKFESGQKIHGTLPINNLAPIENPDPSELNVGSRIVASRPRDTVDARIAKKYVNLALSAYKTDILFGGIVVERACEENKNRFLVFFDDGFAQYLTVKKLHLVTHAAEKVWEDVSINCREFIKEYLEEYPDRPMVKLKTGLTVQTEWNGRWLQAKVVAVDGSLVKMLFDIDKRTEWIYRGSTRLEPLYSELERRDLEALKSKGKKSAKKKKSAVQTKKIEPYIEDAITKPCFGISKFSNTDPKGVLQMSYWQSAAKELASKTSEDKQASEAASPDTDPSSGLLKIAPGFEVRQTTATTATTTTMATSKATATTSRYLKRKRDDDEVSSQDSDCSLDIIGLADIKLGVSDIEKEDSSQGPSSPDTQPYGASIESSPKNVASQEGSRQRQSSVSSIDSNISDSQSKHSSAKLSRLERQSSNQSISCNRSNRSESQVKQTGNHSITSNRYRSESQSSNHSDRSVSSNRSNRSESQQNQPGSNPVTPSRPNRLERQSSNQSVSSNQSNRSESQSSHPGSHPVTPSRPSRLERQSSNQSISSNPSDRSESQLNQLGNLQLTPSRLGRLDRQPSNQSICSNQSNLSESQPNQPGNHPITPTRPSRLERQSSNQSISSNQSNRSESQPSRSNRSNSETQSIKSQKSSNVTASPSREASCVLRNRRTSEERNKKQSGMAYFDCSTSGQVFDNYPNPTTMFTNVFQQFPRIYHPQILQKSAGRGRHICSPMCVPNLYVSMHEKRKHNSLSVPLLLGWTRETAKRRPGYHRDIYYRAPCNKRLRNLAEVTQYLLQNKVTNVTIDQFSFDSSISCRDQLPFLETPRVQYDDISCGKETVPIPCVNEMNEEKPPIMEYIRERTISSKIELNTDPGFLACCQCEDMCQDKTKCPCAKLTVDSSDAIDGTKNVNCGYQYRRLKECVTTGIYECNRQCSCKSSCYNRVVQNGIRLRLQIFMTSHKGWGLRCLDDIPRGTFICTYTGQILNEEMADKEGTDFGDEYLAELDHIEIVEQAKEGYESDVPELRNEKKSIGSPSSENSNKESDSDESEFSFSMSSDSSENTRNSTKTAESNNASPVSKMQRAAQSLAKNPKDLFGIIDLTLDSDDDDDDSDVKSSHSKDANKSLVEISADSTLSDDSSSTTQSSLENMIHKLKTKVIEDKISPKSKRDTSRSHRQQTESSYSRSVDAKEKKKEKDKEKTVDENKKSFDVPDSAAPETQAPSSYVSTFECEKEIIKVAKEIAPHLRKAVARKSTRSILQMLVDRKAKCDIDKKEGSPNDIKSSPVLDRVVNTDVGPCKKFTSPRSSTGGHFARKLTSRHQITPPAQSSDDKKEPQIQRTRQLFGEDQCYVIDAKSFGNVGRYLNHSCMPNLFVQNVFVDTHDLRFPLVAFFAQQNIPALTELTWDYSYDVGSVPGKVLICQCGALECRGRLL